MDKKEDDTSTFENEGYKVKIQGYSCSTKGDWMAYVLEKYKKLRNLNPIKTNLM